MLAFSTSQAAGKPKQSDSIDTSLTIFDAALRPTTPSNGAHPMAFTLGTAAAATGMAKSSILRAFKADRSSASRTEDGSWSIDPVELGRVFPLLSISYAGEIGGPQPDATTDALVAELRAVIADLRSDRDHWREAFERGQMALAATQRLLPPPLEHPAPPDASAPEQTATPIEQGATPPAAPKRRWWRRAG